MEPPDPLLRSSPDPSALHARAPAVKTAPPLRAMNRNTGIASLCGDDVLSGNAPNTAPVNLSGGAPLTSPEVRIAQPKRGPLRHRVRIPPRDRDGAGGETPRRMLPANCP